MRLTLDGESIQEADPESALQAMRQRLRAARLVPSRLLVDGREASLERLGALDGTEADVALATVSLKDAVERGYGNAEKLFPEIEADLERCCDALMVGRTRDALQYFGGACRALEAFFNLMRPLDALTGTDPALAWDREAEAMEPLFRATAGSIQDQDWILVGDQLRYEWGPRLRAWRNRLPAARAAALRLS